MSTRAGRPVDAVALERLRRIAPNLRAARASADDWRAAPLPEEVAFKLTNRCDLRCAHCYQWSPGGYHHRLVPAERGADLDLAVIARVLEATRAVRSTVYLWGGEPLVYRDWDGLVALLRDDPRATSVCTNGTLLVRRLPSLVSLGRAIEVSVSLDGFASEHDAVRGAGSFERAWAGVQALLASRRAGGFAGELTVNFVISDAMVPRMHEFVAFLDDAGIDTVYVSFPWYLAADGAARMDDWVARHFGRAPMRGTASWHAYTFRVQPAAIATLREQIARIDAHRGRIAVRWNPRLDDADLEPFLAGSDRPAQGRTRCRATRARLDVFPNGDVVSCKFFPEFRVGNLHEAELAAIWHGERFDRVRETVHRCGLMPACAKCNLLYTRGA